MTVTGGLDGAAGTAGQFWIGYTAQPGYVISNPGAAPTHIDFYNGDLRSRTARATGDVTWDYQGIVTGTVSFNANATGGSLDYKNSNGTWLHGVVTSYRQIDAHTAVFAGTITDGSPDYTVNHTDGPDYFFAKVVDGGTSGSNGDQIAVLGERRPHRRQRRLRHVSGRRDRHRRQPGRPLTTLLINPGSTGARRAPVAVLRGAFWLGGHERCSHRLGH